jgi:hypothetical protein
MMYDTHRLANTIADTFRMLTMESQGSIIRSLLSAIFGDFYRFSAIFVDFCLLSPNFACFLRILLFSKKNSYPGTKPLVQEQNLLSRNKISHLSTQLNS